MLKLHDFACLECDAVFEVLHEADDVIHCEECGGMVERLISGPPIHTLETHMRGFTPHSADEQWAPGHGGFRDVNLCDPKTGKPAVYSTLAEKRRLLKEYGLIQKEPTKDRFRKRKSQRSMIFDGSSKRTSQQGIN